MPPSTDRYASAQEDHWNRLLYFMDRERPYLDPFLMQEDVSDRLSLSTRTLSRLLSERTDQNFCSFINAYRLEEACRLLRNSKLRHLSILQVARQSGFNSSGTFYRAFREVAGMSPTTYRKRHAAGLA